MQALAPQDTPRDGAGPSHTQCGALCWRRAAKGGGVEVLLVTSRDTGRWVIPKGWPVPGLSLADSAAREAWEEAGVEGPVSPECLGYYSYDKRLPADGPGAGSLPCVVAVYPLHATEVRARFPEARQRRRKWFTHAKAVRKVAEPELADILCRFDPDAAPPAPGDGEAPAP